jgi:S-adenosylmethionine synthetase
MERIHIQQLRGPDQHDVEIVERKGLGHPDTICDLVMEQISLALYRAYSGRCGRLFHFNCDKGLLVAGQVERRFGGGKVIEPMRLVIGDRATPVKEFDIREIAIETAKCWFREHLPEVDPDRHVTYQVELKGGSEELTGIFQETSTVALANDTSAAVGYAPLSETEQLVLEAERFLNGPEFKRRYPESGKDVKIMGVREGSRLDITAAMPLLDRYTDDEASYFEKKQEMREVLSAHLRSRLARLDEINVNLNTLDRPGRGLAGIYLSVLGTSAEDADSGEVGRGNQVNGIIALNRPRGSEAAAGKNPLSHVGKIYSVLTHLLARQIHAEIPGVEQVVVWLCSSIGDPIDKPQMASVQVRLERQAKFADVAEPIRQIMVRELERMPSLCEELAQGKYAIC